MTLSMGLHTLHAMPAGPHDVDIVALHGLGGDPIKTWTHPQAGSCWLKDWLHKDISGARIMTYAYNADAAFGNTVADIFDHAKALLSCLQDKRELDEERNIPLVFVAHSLGGIITKQALIYANLDPRYSDILKATKGIVFFATPHRGSNKADYAHVLSNLSSHLTRRPPSALVAALQTNSEVLYRLTTEFQFRLPQLQVVSFYETQPMKPFKSLIVEKESSQLIVPNEESIPVDADHSKICKFETREDAIYEMCYKRIVRIVKAANEMSCTVEGTGNVHWKVPRSSSTIFTGRSALIEHLKTELDPSSLWSKQNQIQKRYILSGIGGIGKSEVCLKVAEIIRDKFWGIFWIDASSSENAERDFIEVSRLCGTPRETFNGAKDWLASTRKTWLLIIDNADDRYLDLATYFPSGNRGTVIVTTRNPQCTIHGTLGDKNLEQLEVENASELLFKVLGTNESQQKGQLSLANKITRLLGFHTLAIIQAGAYIRRGFCSMEDYPSAFLRRRDQLMRFRSIQAQSVYKNAYTTLDMSIKSLTGSEIQEEEDALELLRWLSVMHFQNVPFEIFEKAWGSARALDESNSSDSELDLDSLSKWHISRLPNFLEWRLTKWEPARLRYAADVLVSCSLISTTFKDNREFFSMHTLAHLWARDRLSDEEKTHAWDSVISTLAFAGEGFYRFNLLWTYLGSHLSSINYTQVSSGFQEDYCIGVAQALYRLSWILHHLRMDSFVLTILNALETVLVGKRLDDLTVAKIDHLKGINLVNRGQSKKAAELLEQVLKMRERTLKPNHPDCLESQQALAGAYMVNGWNKQAAELLEQVVKIRETTLDQEHPDYLASQHELAVVYMINGQNKEAAELLEHVVKIRVLMLDQEHPDRLGSQHELAGVYLANGHNKAAAELLKEVVKIRTKTLGLEHPDRLASQHELARAYMSNRRDKEAAELLEHVVKIREGTLDQEHPDYLTSQHELARAYMGNKRDKEAAELLEHVVKIREGTLDQEHPDYLTSQYELARAYVAIQQEKEAVELLEQVVKIREKTLDEEHPDRLASQHALAGAYMANGQNKQAAELLEKVVKIRKKTLDEAHPDCLTSQHDLAVAYMANGRNKQAVELLEYVFKIRKTTLDLEHPDRLTSQHELARAYITNRQKKEAVELLEQVVKIQRRTLGQEHPYLSISQHDLAVAYLGDKQNNRAVELLEQVLKVYEGTGDQTSQNCLASQQALALAYMANGRNKQAAELLEQVVKMRKMTLNSQHPDLLQSQHELARVYLTKGRNKKAVELLEQVLKIRKTMLEPEHPDRRASQYELARAYMANWRNKKAAELLEQLVKIEEKALDPEDLDRLTSQHELARAYMANKQNMQAVELLEHVVKIQKGTLDEEHRHRLASEHELARAYIAIRRNDEAAELLEHVVQIYKRTLDPKHPDRLTSQKTLIQARMGSR